MRQFCLILTLLTSSLWAQDHAKVDAKIIRVQEEYILAVNFEHDDHWHTYWKNPGDAGLATKFKFKIEDEAVSLNDYPWPTPHTIAEGDLRAYGYEGKVSFFFGIPDQYISDKLAIKTQYLICKDICIPEQKNLEIDLSKDESNSTLTDLFMKLPKKSELVPEVVEMTLNQNEKGQLFLHYTVTNIERSQFPDHGNLIFPYMTEMFTYGHEKLGYDENLKTAFGEIPIDWNGEYQEPPVDLPKDGIFEELIEAEFQLNIKGNNGVIFNFSFDEFNLKGFDSFHGFVTSNTLLEQSSKGGESNENSLLIMLLFALLGGFILNFMPCVLPVISLKLFALVAHSDENKKQILKHNLAYTLGVVSSFIVLAIVVVLLKVSGENIGWGFQMQSPTFVLSMLILMLVMAMNMLGLFEFITPGGKTLGTKQLKKGMSGDFFNGILATILSTPCSAPFLGAALGYAFTTSTLNIFLIFIFVGLGLSLPFILTAFIPSLVKLLPRPGAWMEKLKMVLGLSLLLTAVWLYDVLASLIDFSFVGIYLNTFLILLFFAFYFRKNITKIFAWNVLVFILPLLLLFGGVQNGLLEVSTASTRTQSTSNVKWNKWSEEAVAKTEGVVFINFTASWCLTCKVNKKVVLNSDAFADLVEEKNITLYEGDWTKRDDKITNFLKKYKAISVPAYFLKKADGKLIFLGETISIEKIKIHL
jgi:cytochrome c biogenesis protein CcdA/thiol-disulfide isomerase/thioredoxin